MFALCSNIRIGEYSFNSINSVSINRSVYELGATATIKVPVTAVLRQQDNKAATVTETARKIAVGQEVTIELGYDQVFNVEFRGYVKQLNYCTPLEIICEDAFWKTRSKQVTMSGKTTLKEVLEKCGLTIGKAAELTIDSFQVPNRSVAWVLAKLKKDYGLAIFFGLDGQVYAVDPSQVQGDPVRYLLQENVLSTSELKFMKAADNPVRITAVCIYRDGSRAEATTGSEDGTEKKLWFYNVKDEKELKQLAETELRRHSYDGYSGKIQTFLLPNAAPGMIARLEDGVYPERNGNYYISGVETTFGTSGARRNIEIGIRI